MVSEAIESLAAEIGENIYIEVAKWHLFLNDAHLHIPLAERVYPLIQDGAVTSTAVADILQSITVKLGGEQVELPLAQLIPQTIQNRLVDLLENYREP